MSAIGFSVKVDSIKVGTTDVSTTSPLAKKVDDFVQSEVFKKQLADAKSGDQFRLVKKGDTLTLEKKDGDNWVKQTIQEAATTDLKKTLTRLETAAQGPYKTAWNANSCYLNASYALVSNTSLKDKLLDPAHLQGKAQKLADPSSIKCGSELRECLGIKDTQQDDPSELFEKLRADRPMCGYKVAQDSIKAHANQLDKDSLEAQLAATDADYKTLSGKGLWGMPAQDASSPIKELSFTDLMEQNLQNKKITVNLGEQESKVTYNLTFDYTQPVFIEINRAQADEENSALKKDTRPIKDIPLVLPQQNENSDPASTSSDATQVKELRLQGFIVHKGSSANSGHYITYVRKENIEGNYDWWKINGKDAEIQTEDAIKKDLVQATHLYYDKDPEDTGVEQDPEDTGVEQDPEDTGIESSKAVVLKSSEITAVSATQPQQLLFQAIAFVAFAALAYFAIHFCPTFTPHQRMLMQ